MAGCPLKTPANATLVRREVIEPDLARFWILPDTALKPPRPDAPPFLPGQYVTLGIRADGEKTILRPMTITSAPESSGPLEFAINRVPVPASPTPLSHHLFDLPLGARLFVRPTATGHFTLQSPSVAERPTKLLMAQDTGIAPFASMVRSRHARSERLTDLVLWQEAERPTGLMFSEEFRDLRAHGLAYRAWPTRRSTAELHDALHHLAVTRGPMTPRNCAVLVCGLGSMIRDAIEALLTWGHIPPQRRLRKLLGVSDEPSVFIEQYDQERLFDLTDEETVTRLRKLFDQGQSHTRGSDAGNP